MKSWFGLQDSQLYVAIASRTIKALRRSKPLRHCFVRQARWRDHPAHKIPKGIHGSEASKIIPCIDVNEQSYHSKKQEGMDLQVSDYAPC